MLVGAVGGLPPTDAPCGNALGVWLGAGMGFRAFATGGAAGFGAPPACRTAGMSLAPVPGGGAGAFGPPGWMTFLTICVEVCVTSVAFFCSVLSVSVAFFATLRTTFLGSPGAPSGLIAGGASTIVPSGLLTTRLTTFLVPGAAPGTAAGAGPLAGAPGGGALISRAGRRFCVVFIRVFRSPHDLESENSAAAA